VVLGHLPRGKGFYSHWWVLKKKKREETYAHIKKKGRRTPSKRLESKKKKPGKKGTSDEGHRGMAGKISERFEGDDPGGVGSTKGSVLCEKVKGGLEKILKK